MKPWMFLSCLLFITGLLNAAPLQQLQPWLGVSIDEKGAGGVLIKTVINQTPAEKAGLQSGDLITAVDESPVKTREELMSVLRSKGVGNKVTVHFKREGKTANRTLQLEALPDRVELMKKQVLNKPLPTFSLVKLSDRKSIRNQDLQGKVSIVEFWATWCPACRSAIPRLNQWSKTHKNIQLIGVTDEDEGKVKEFVKRENIGYTIARDEEEMLQSALQVGSIPTFLLVDGKGVVRDIALGAGDYLEALLQKAEKLSP